MPMMAIEIIKAAVAVPSLLNIAWRRGTIEYKAITPIKFNFPNCAVDSFFFFDSPKCLGNKIVVASGHTFLHTPIATTSNAGATGIRIFQNNSRPTEGKNNKQNNIVAPTAQTAACTIRQIKMEPRDN